MPSYTGIQHLGATPGPDVLYVPDGWIEQWQAAKQASSSRVVGVAAIGASIIAGLNSTNVMTASYWAAIRHYLGGKYGVAYDCIDAQYNATNLNGVANSPNTNSFTGGVVPPNGVSKSPSTFSDAAPWVLTAGTSTIVGGVVPTATATISTAVSANTRTTVTYTSSNPFPIPPGTSLSVAAGGGVAETVTVLASTPPGAGNTAGTFTAFFAQAHPTPSYAATGKWPTVQQVGAGGLFYTVGMSAGTGAATFTSPYSCSAMDILYEDQVQGSWTFTVDSGTGGRTFDYSIDGGTTVVGQATNVAITVNNVGRMGGRLRCITIRNLSTTGTHTVTITQNATIDYVAKIGAVTCYNSGTGQPPTTGMGFAWGQQGSLGAISLLWNPHIAWRWGKQAMLAAPSLTGWTGAPFGPDLVFLEVSANDMMKGPMSPRQNFNAVQKLILSLQRGNPTCCVVLCVAGISDSFASDNPQAFNPTIFQVAAGQPNAPWSTTDMNAPYMHALLDLARSYQCVLMDATMKWGETPTTGPYGAVTGPYQYGYSSPSFTGDIHPTNAGHNDMFDILLEIL